ncbi:hypothetical protein ACN28S_33440 [Cystobacter fuscus]
MRVMRNVLFLGSVLSLAACGGNEMEMAAGPEELGQSVAPSASGRSGHAVINLSNVGVFVAVAAGNDNADACNDSPASST